MLVIDHFLIQFKVAGRFKIADDFRDTNSHGVANQFKITMLKFSIADINFDDFMSILCYQIPL